MPEREGSSVVEATSRPGVAGTEAVGAGSCTESALDRAPESIVEGAHEEDSSARIVYGCVVSVNGRIAATCGLDAECTLNIGNSELFPTTEVLGMRRTSDV
jgi:hypothetical protein